MKCPSCNGTGEIFLGTFAVWNDALTINRGLFNAAEIVDHIIVADALPAGTFVSDRLALPDMRKPPKHLTFQVCGVDYDKKELKLA